jgi:hypothetical protein
VLYISQRNKFQKLHCILPLGIIESKMTISPIKEDKKSGVFGAFQRLINPQEI